MADSPVLFEFADFQFDPRTRVLTRAGSVVSLTSQPALALDLLLRRAGSVVSREELRHHLWGERSVDVESGLNFCLHQVRKALEDDSRHPRFIRTLPGTGYQFLAPVTRVTPIRIHRYQRPVVLAAVLGLLWITGGPADYVAEGPVTVAAQVMVSAGDRLDQPMTGRLADSVSSRLRAWRPADGARPSHRVTVALNRLPDSGVELDYRIVPMGERVDAVEGKIRASTPDDRLFGLAAQQIERAVTRMAGGADAWPAQPGAVMSRQRIRRVAPLGASLASTGPE